MQICKKYLCYDIVTFILGVLFLTVAKLLISYGISTDSSYVINAIISCILIAFLVFNIYVANKKEQYKSSVANIVLSAVIFVLYYLIYSLPIFDFVGNKGINNTIGITFLFILGTRIHYNISSFFKFRSRSEMYGIKPNALNYTRNYYKIFNYLGNYVLVGSIIIVIINTIFNVIVIPSLFNF